MEWGLWRGESFHPFVYSPSALKIQGEAKARSWELNPSRPCSWQEPNYLNHHMLPPKVCIVLESGDELGFEPRTPIWSCGCPSQQLNCRSYLCPSYPFGQGCTWPALPAQCLVEWWCSGNGHGREADRTEKQQAQMTGCICFRPACDLCTDPWTFHS